MKREVNANQVLNYLAAGYSGFIVRTLEARRADEVLTEMIDNAKRKDGNIYTTISWDVVTANSSDPMKPLDDLASDSTDEFTILLLHNYHWFLDKPPIIQRIQSYMDAWRNRGKAIIILSPFVEIPLEIRKDFMLLELPLPDETEIRGCMHHIASSAGDMSLLDGDNESIIQAAKGLTKTEIENVFSLSWATTNKFDLDVINEQKIQTIEKSGLIEVLRTDRTYADILGYDRAKEIVGKMIRKRTSKGQLFVGPPGCGKTSFIMCTVGEYKKIGLLINFGRLYSKWQGEGTENVEEIIHIIEAIGDCVVIMDEFEKQFSGAASTGETDGGTSRRMTGRWLQFMSEKPEGVYLMGTCNSFKGIPDEYLRAGRWDGSPLYIDIPQPEEQMAILEYYINKFELDGGLKPPKMPNWTGAEIESCCLMAKNMEIDLEQASKYIKPQNIKGFAEADELRKFAVPASSTASTKPSAKKRKLDQTQ